MKRLSDAVAIKSVSAWTVPEYRDEIVRMINHVKDVRMSLHPLIIGEVKFNYSGISIIRTLVFPKLLIL